MHKEYKTDLGAAHRAFFLSDLLENITPLNEALSTVIAHVVDLVLKQGEKKYKPEERETMDVLVYVNLQQIGESKASDWPDLTPLAVQGWRSVSFTRGNNSSCVLLTQPSAPQFLRDAQEKLLFGVMD